MPTQLEEVLARLLTDAERLLPLVVAPSHRWTITSETKESTQSQVMSVTRHAGALVESYARALGAMHKLESFTRAKSAFEGDKTFTEGQRAAGYWASFESVLQSVIMSCGRMGKRKVKIDLPCAMRLVASIRSGLQQKQLQYSASCRLFGVELAPRRLDCPDHMSIHRLTRKERNERQPTIDPFFGSSMDHHELLSARTEVRLPLVVTVDHSEEAAIFAASNRATELARTAFGRLISALLVTRPGLAQLGPLSLKGGLAGMGLGQFSSRRELIPIKLQLTARDLPHLTTAYGLFAENSGDRTLARALHTDSSWDANEMTSSTNSLTM